MHGGLFARSSCALSFSATPPSTAELAATVRIDAGGERLEIPVRAHGTDCAALPISPMIWDFGDVVVGERSRPHPFSVTNSGAETSLPFLGVALSGLDASPFEIVRDGCGGHGLATGATCRVEVVFAPVAVGAAAAELGVENARASLTGRAVEAP